MPRVVHSPEDFIAIGENIHATRVLLRNGRRAVTLEDGTEAVPFKGPAGEQRYLTVPEWFKATQPYSQGQVKHFLIAMMKGVSDDPREQEEGTAYVQHEARRQVRAGARYLDINVDEVHYNSEVQRRCMRWAVQTVQQASSLPPCVDSSLTEVIAEGLAAYDRRAGPPLVNSVAMERLDTLDLAIEHNARVTVMATSASGMPEDDEQRVENARALVERVTSRGVPLRDVFVDAIVFPICVDQQNVNHYLNAVRTMRETFGNEIHIGGGLSNVSFGMPNRRLINDTFIYLALEAGIDSGILDPVQTKIASVLSLDTESGPARLACDMLLGHDDFCMGYIQAWRDGRLG